MSKHSKQAPGVQSLYVFLLKLVEDLLGYEKRIECFRLSYDRRDFYDKKNTGKVFAPTTALFSMSVEVCTKCLCAVLSARVLSETDVLSILEDFSQKVLPRFYQDAMHVRKDLLLATFHPGELTCAYPAVLERVLSMKGGVRPKNAPSCQYHRRMYSDDVIRFTVYSSMLSADGCAMLIIRELFGDTFVTPDMHEYATQLAYAPGGPVFRYVMEQFYKTADGMTLSSSYP